MKKVLAVRVEEDLAHKLNRTCRQLGVTRSQVVREALRRHLALLTFERLRRQILPFAEARGYLIDEDVFRGVS